MHLNGYVSPQSPSTSYVENCISFIRENVHIFVTKLILYNTLTDKLEVW